MTRVRPAAARRAGRAAAVPLVVVALTAAATATASCGASAAQRTNTTEATVPPGDLAPAVQTGAGATDQGTTGVFARVVLGGRRQRVVELLGQYISALVARDLERVRALFDEQVANTDVAGEPHSRDAVMEYHAQLVARADLASLAAAASRPVVQSYVELRAGLRYQLVPAAMRPGDWLIEGFSRTGMGFQPAISWPRRILVRWLDDEPRIVGISLPVR